MLVINELSCERGGRVLFNGLSLKLSAGDLLHVQGANGSGKTSLLRMLCGLSPPASGSIFWNGMDIGELREDYAANVTYIGHHPAVKDDLSPLENLRISQALAGQPVSPPQVKQALATVALKSFSNLPVRVLSQGQRRRVALARLWLCDKPLWVLDEPFNALDAEASAQLERHIEAHLGRGGMAVLTTHQQLGIVRSMVRSLRLTS
jgi:heme exporter protein A